MFNKNSKVVEESINIHFLDEIRNDSNDDDMTTAIKNNDNNENKIELIKKEKSPVETKNSESRIEGTLEANINNNSDRNEGSKSSKYKLPLLLFH